MVTSEPIHNVTPVVYRRTIEVGPYEIYAWRMETGCPCHGELCCEQWARYDGKDIGIHA